MSHTDALHHEASVLQEEMPQPKADDFNALIKKSAERLLPLLGDELQLSSFLASDVVPADVGPTQIEELLAELFATARQQVVTPGTAFLRTENVTISSDEYPHARPETASHVVLSLLQTGCLTKDDPTEVTEVMLRGVRRIVAQSRGFVSLTQTVAGETLIKIHLPALAQFPLSSPGVDRKQTVESSAQCSAMAILGQLRDTTEGDAVRH
jgi:hypothetical protein